jgi:hypothetical protein
MLDSLTVAAEGEKSDNSKPFKGIDNGVFEISLQYRGEFFSVCPSGCGLKFKQPLGKTITNN